MLKEKYITSLSPDKKLSHSDVAAVATRLCVQGVIARNGAREKVKHFYAEDVPSQKLTKEAMDSCVLRLFKTKE